MLVFQIDPCVQNFTKLACKPLSHTVIEHLYQPLQIWLIHFPPDRYMRTATNIYLFNLALADLATLMLAMPAELYTMWRQYPWTYGEVS